jgi:carbonic anhydrase
VLKSNAHHAAAPEHRGKVGLPPARRFAILTCLDSAIDLVKLAALREGEADVIRNAGGRASEHAIRSLVAAYRLHDAREWFVVHHNHCGLELFTHLIVRGELEDEDEDEDWLLLRNQEESVTADVQRIRTHELVPRDIAIYGYIYLAETGTLTPVHEATTVGRAS